VLQAPYNLADDQAEYQLRDRLSFMRFLGLELEDTVPDAKTLWLYREALGKAGAVEELFDLFDGFLKDKGYLAMGGQIIDATIVSAPKQHNSGEENETIKEGETPEDWKSKPAKNRQKDKDARWTKKHERSYFGYKNHIGVGHKFVRRYVGATRAYTTVKSSKMFLMRATRLRTCGPTAPIAALRSRKSSPNAA